MAQGRRRRRRYWWSDLSREDLLQVRLCDLGLGLEGTALEARINRLHSELGKRGFRWKPYVWLSTDWFTPDGCTGFAAPFFLAHPRLARLERRMMYDVEGAAHDECMRILRHEAAHALDNAYRLHRKKAWRETFGRYSEPYHEVYEVNPGSRKFVYNLDYWYAQSHPAEDYAETFAVWLRGGWRKDYAGWPALKKLEFMGEFMESIRELPPPVRTRSTLDSLPRLKLTLAEYYEERRGAFDVKEPVLSDRFLHQLFPTHRDGTHRKGAGSSGNGTVKAAASRDSNGKGSSTKGRSVGISASRFLRQHSATLRRQVSRYTGQEPYAVDQALRTAMVRCDELELRCARPSRQTLLGAAIVLASLSTSMMQGSRRRYRR